MESNELSSQELAPVVYFAFNRPDHARQSLTALKDNSLSEQSLLYIHCDGPRADETEDSLRRIAEVRDLVASEPWCGTVEFILRETNLGLQKGLSSTITELLQHHDRLIILEDDVVPRPGFLEFMNEALRLYAEDPEVMHVSAFSPPRRGHLEIPETTFFYNHTTCWGWGTWARAWRYFRNEPLQLRAKIARSKRKYYLNLDGTFDIYWGLKYIAEGAFADWNYPWHASVNLNRGLCLHPVRSLTSNIGFDALGTNNQSDHRKNLVPLADFVPVERIALCEHLEMRREIHRKPALRLRIWAKDIIRGVLAAAGVKRFR